MAAAFTLVKSRDLGNGNKMVIGTLAFDDSYPTNGETVDLSSYFPGGTIDFVAADPVSAGGYVVGHDYGTAAAGKFKVFTGDYDPAADSPLVECDNTANLAALTAVRVIVFGH